MESNVKAVFYKYKYYIFPEEFSDLSKIEYGTVINAKRLKEERCMAPDFIYESIEDEKLEIENPQLLFPVTVTLRTGKEYDEILNKRIDAVCHGCARFIDNDDETLNGHHREISLDGVCYERETEDDEPTFSNRAYWFLEDVLEKIEEIKKYIDAGNNKKLNKICQTFTCIPLPYQFFGDKKDGKYRLFWRGYCGDDFKRILQYFVAEAAKWEGSPTNNQGIEIVPYIPLGAEIKCAKINCDELLYSVCETSVPWSVDVNVYSKKRLSEKALDKKLTDLHNFLSVKMGEDVILRTVAGYDVIYDKPEKLVSLNELIKILQERDDILPVKKYPPVYPMVWENQESALYGKHTYSGVTRCFSLTEIGADAAEAENVDFYDCTAYAYLFIPTSLENTETVANVVTEYFASENDIPEPVMIKDDYIGCFTYLGGGEGKTSDGHEGVVFDFLVADENAFYRFIKILAPVLISYNARLVVVNGSGVNEYECGYKITPVGGTHLS